MIKKGTQKKIKKFGILFMIILIVFLCFQLNVFAIEDNDIKAVLNRYPEFFRTNNFIYDIGHYLGWYLVLGLKWLADICATLYQNTLGLVDFSQYEALNSWMQSLKMVFTGILAVSIMAYGIILIVDHEKKPKIFTALLLASISISAVSDVLIIVNEGTIAITGEIINGVDLQDDVINDNFYDLLYLDKTLGLENMATTDETQLKAHHYTDPGNWNNIDINEVINYDSEFITTGGAKGKDGILGKKIVLYPSDAGNQSQELVNIYNGFGWNSEDEEDFFNEFYYRYQVDYFPIILSFLAIVVVYLAISYKAARIIFEIAVGRVMASLYSANLTGTQKTIKIFKSLIDGYIVLILTSVLIKVFSFARGYLETFNFNTATYAIIYLFIAFAVCDGPNLIQQLTGIDAGLSSGVGKMIAGYHMAKGAMGLATAPYNIVKQHQRDGWMKKQANGNGGDTGGNVGGNGNGNPPSSGGNNTGKGNIPPNGADGAGNTPPNGGENQNENTNLNDNTDNMNNTQNNNIDESQNISGGDGNTNVEADANKNENDVFKNGSGNGSVPDDNINTSPLQEFNPSGEIESGINESERMNKEISSMESGNINGSSGIEKEAPPTYTGNILQRGERAEENKGGSIGRHSRENGTRSVSEPHNVGQSTKHTEHPK